MPRGGADMLAWANRMVVARRRRYAYFGDRLFADPAWDILLELFLAELEHRAVPVTDLCSASNVPDTTILRWIRRLEIEGTIVRARDPVDKRRVLVQLSEAGCEAMQHYFEEQMRASEEGCFADAALGLIA